MGFEGSGLVGRADSFSAGVLGGLVAGPKKSGRYLKGERGGGPETEELDGIGRNWTCLV